MIAALAFSYLGACKGIEILENLSLLGQEVTTKLTKLCKESAIPCAPISVVTGDIIAEDWSDADIIFAASVCFSNELMELFADRCVQLKKGTRILFMNYLPERPYIEEVASMRGNFTWGLHLLRYYVIV